VDIDNDGHVEVLVAVSYYFEKDEYAGRDLDFDPSLYVAGGLACWDLEVIRGCDTRLGVGCIEYYVLNALLRLSRAESDRNELLVACIVISYLHHHSISVLPLLQSQDWTWLSHLDLTTDKTKYVPHAHTCLVHE
jgi:hypothetical protein